MRATGANDQRNLQWTKDHPYPVPHGHVLGYIRDRILVPFRVCSESNKHYRLTRASGLAEILTQLPEESTD